MYIKLGNRRKRELKHAPAAQRSRCVQVPMIPKEGAGGVPDRELDFSYEKISSGPRVLWTEEKAVQWYKGGIVRLGDSKGQGGER